MPPKKKVKKKTKQKQKQKQTQNQKVIINLATPRKQIRKPKVSNRPQSARVLAQYFPVDRQVMINPIIRPSQPFQESSQPFQIENSFAERSPAVRVGSITGRSPREIRLTDGLPELNAAEERRKQFLKEEQSLSGFSDSLGNYQPPSLKSGVEPSFRSADFQSIPSDFTFDTSDAPSSRIGLNTRAFDDFEGTGLRIEPNPRGRPRNQPLREYLTSRQAAEPRAADDRYYDTLIKNKSF